MIDDVPDVISPIEAKPVYVQLSDGDKSMLMQAWRASIPNSISSLGCRVARTKQSFHTRRPIASFLVDWALDAPVFPEPPVPPKHPALPEPPVPPHRRKV